MPELPEVEALANALDTRVRARRVERTFLASFAALKTYLPALDSLHGQAMSGCQRRGKFLLLSVGGAFLVIHLAKDGWIRWHDDFQTEEKISWRGPLCLRIIFDNASALELSEKGTTKRVAIYLTTNLESVDRLNRLGIDALSPELTIDRWSHLISENNLQLKRFLTDQRLIAGIGNAYSDEILHAAKLSPFSRTTSLSTEARQHLYETMHQILNAALHRARELPIEKLRGEKKVNLRIHGRGGEPCPDCGDAIRDIWVGERSWQYCPTCQTGGKIHRDRRLSRLLR